MDNWIVMARGEHGWYEWGRYGYEAMADKVAARALEDEFVHEVNVYLLLDALIVEEDAKAYELANRDAWFEAEADDYGLG